MFQLGEEAIVELVRMKFSFLENQRRMKAFHGWPGLIHFPCHGIRVHQSLRNTHATTRVSPPKATVTSNPTAPANHL